MKKIIFFAVIATITLAGCATKRHGRLSPLSQVEKGVYDCEQIRVELAKIEEFQKQMAENSKINIASVGGFLGDFGLGNAMERNAASKSALKRQEELVQLQREKECE